MILNKGGSVGAYIKEPFTYVEFGDIINLDKSAEHYWLEVSGLKNSLHLVGICYQPSSIYMGKENDLTVLNR